MALMWVIKKIKNTNIKEIENLITGEHEED